jgi:hypothetical protein
MLGSLERTKAAIGSLGYNIMDNVPRLSRNDAWYTLDALGGAINHYIFLENRPASQKYNLYVGVYNIESRKLANEIASSSSGYLSPALLDKKFHLFSRPCWSLFNAGRALRWPGMGVPDHSDEKSPERMINELYAAIIEPKFLSIDSPGRIVDFLLRDDFPFEWVGTNTLLRAIEVVGLCGHFVEDVEPVKRELASRSRWTRRDAERAPGVEFLIDDLFEKLSIVRRGGGTRLPESR